MSFESAVDRLLIERRRAFARDRGLPGWTAAVGLHVMLALIVFLGSRGPKTQLPEFLAVEIIPAARLGVEEPPPPSPPAEAPPAPEPPAPAPQPVAPPRESVAPPPSKSPAVSVPATPAPPAAAQGTPEGSATGASAFGTSVSRLDDPTFTYGYYVDQMLGLVRGHWVRPALGGGIESVVHFRIRRDGRVSDLRIVQSSGYASFDLAARRAIEAASPLPPLPRGYRGDSLGVTLVVR